jgi:phosphoglycolate phosphatase-like HAD superfamily hydrolase
VGDSPYDFQTAQNAGLNCFLIASGTHNVDELTELNREQTFTNFGDLINAILR